MYPYINMYAQNPVMPIYRHMSTEYSHIRGRDRQTKIWGGNKLANDKDIYIHIYIYVRIVYWIEVNYNKTNPYPSHPA